VQKKANYSTIHPLKQIIIQHLSMNDLAKYLVRSPKQVFNYLKMLSKERCLISAGFGEGEKDTFLTAIIKIDEKKQTLTIDCGPKEYLNKRLLDSAIIKCSTEYQGIKVLFEGRRVKKSGTSSNPSFLIPVPKSLFWIQRRQFYRVKSPLSKGSHCIITIQDPETKEDQQIPLTLNDISVSGIAIQNKSKALANYFEPTKELYNCQLILENETELTLDLEVRHVSNHNIKPERVGCYITNSTPRIESTIMRYMQNIERETRQKA